MTMGPPRVRRRTGLLTIAMAAVLVACTSPSREAAPPGSSTSVPGVTSTTSRPVETTKTPRSARRYDPTLRSTISSLNRMWAKWLPEVYDIPYRRLRGGIYAYRSDTVTPECGGSRFPYLLIRENAFYCPDDDLIAWDDEGLFPRLSKKHGELLLGVVLAHEWGHAIQERADLTYELDTITAEQQADCFAGAWLAGLDETIDSEAPLIELRDKNIDRVLAGFVEFRDYVGLDERFAGSHGTAFDRIRAFQEGFETGPERCRDYEDDQPPLVGFAFRDLKERFRGGNLPFAEIFPASIATFAAADEEAGSSDVVFVDRTGLTRQPVCARPLNFSGPMRKAVRACLDGRGSVFYDRRALKVWYDKYGDFSVSTVLGLAWASTSMGVAQIASTATVGSATVDSTMVDPIFGEAVASTDATDVVARLGTRTSKREADCRTGRWASALVDFDDPEQSQLSPGDLDEAAQTLLELAATERSPGLGFSRVSGFRAGLLGGDCSDLAAP